MSRQKKFYIEPRKPSGIYYFIIRDPLSRKTIAYKSIGTTDKKQAEAIGMEWWSSGIPGKSKGNSLDRKTTFCDYLCQFWDFETSNYFRELETMGKTPHIEHALETQKLIKRYFLPYFQGCLLCQIDEEKLQEFVVFLKKDKGVAASTVNKARNAAIVTLRYTKRKKIIQHFDFDHMLRAGGKGKERGILEQAEIDQLFNLEWPKIPNGRPYCRKFWYENWRI